MSKSRAVEELEEATRRASEASERLIRAKRDLEASEGRVRALHGDITKKKGVEEQLQLEQRRLVALRSENKSLRHSSEKLKREHRELQVTLSTQLADNDLLRQSAQRYREDAERLAAEVERLEDKISESHVEFLRIQGISTQKQKPLLTRSCLPMLL